ncbi:pRL2-23 [Streptomyces albidoflavus]|uniref:pRL2-23 n=1 Tax=Streptomyces albidoflavus TaxID=1886 RepID=UPI00101EA6E4|nr:pRL2-23 [Streptomyces albidoflavus]RZD64985.1 pRL2-23 [Streptomyces albidoflavus]
MLATLLAVAGTLLGALVSGLLQHHLTRAARAEARAVQHRTAQLDAVTDLADALSAHRRAMWAVLDATLTGAEDGRVTELRDESHRTRAAVTAPAVRIRLLIADQAVRDAATTAIAATYAIRDAADPAHLDALRQAALSAHDHLVEKAARHPAP